MKNIERMQQGLVYISDDDVFDAQKPARRLTQKLNTIDRSDPADSDLSQQARPLI